MLMVRWKTLYMLLLLSNIKREADKESIFGAVWLIWIITQSLFNEECIRGSVLTHYVSDCSTGVCKYLMWNLPRPQAHLSWLLSIWYMIIATHSGKEMKSFQILGSYVKTTSQDFTEKHFTLERRKLYILIKAPCMEKQTNHLQNMPM